MINLAHLLYKNGINNVCISPGLRNTAISLSFIKHGKFNCHSIIDERSAGYFAPALSRSARIFVFRSAASTPFLTTKSQWKTMQRKWAIWNDSAIWQRISWGRISYHVSQFRGNATSRGRSSPESSACRI